MDVFSKSYLEEVVENQGKLFEYAQDNYPEMDIENFIETYMKSHTRAMLDKGQAYVCTMDAESLFHYFLSNDHYEIKRGESNGGFAPNWIGQFYALFQWTYQLTSKDVVELIPVHFMFEGYPGLHDLDLQTAVYKVGNQCGLKEPKEDR
ncbi:MAG: hypothetical protein KHX69_08585 [Clostridium sp.]|nr:hypothetical protein [Clostridium sp.]